MILFLDNAPYHKKSPAGNVVTTGRGITKEGLCGYADSLTPPLEEITVERDGENTVFARDTFPKTGGRNAPTVSELADAVASAKRRELPGGKCMVCTAKYKRDRWCECKKIGLEGGASGRNKANWAKTGQSTSHSTSPSNTFAGY